MDQATRCALMAAVAASLFTAFTHAADKGSTLVFRDGSPLTTRNGDCIHTKDWTPALAHSGCKLDTPKAAPRAPSPAPARPRR
jgi:hypothetical protein